MKYIDLVVSTESGGYHPVDEIIADSSDVSRGRVNYINLLQDGTIMSLYTVEGPVEELEEKLDEHLDVLRHDIFEVSDDEHHVYVHVDQGEPVTEILDLIEELRIMIDTPLKFTEKGLKVRAIAERGVLNEAIERVPDEIQFEILKVGEYSSEKEGVLTKLTEKQREALETAVELGYYNIPRKASHKQVADRMEVADSTAAEHLRKAESKVMNQLIGK